jgi:hypothetical protein
MPYIALTGLILYTIGCYIWGGKFPFYNFKLYAEAGNRDKAAVPVFFCEEKEANIWDYEHFLGIDPEQFLAHHMPTSVTWMVEEAAQWVRDHQLKDQEQGSFAVSFGFRVLSINDDGSINETIKILERGWAWKR